MKGFGVYFLRRCLDSIVKQVGLAADDLEIVVCDQSADLEINRYLRSYKSNHLIKYVKNNLTSRGITQNLNFGLRFCEGDYVKILFQDDFLNETNYLAQLKSTCLSSTARWVVSSAAHTKDGVTYFDKIIPTANHLLLLGVNTISSPSVVTIRKEDLLNIKFDENLQHLMDCEFYHHCINALGYPVIAESVSIVNGQWPGQHSASVDLTMYEQEIRYCIRKYGAEIFVDLIEEHLRIDWQSDRAIVLANILRELR